MATRRKLDDALEYGRSMQPIHELQSAGAGAAPEDIVAILDVSEVDADAQPKKITLQELVSAAGGGSATPAGNAGEIQINDGADPPNLGAVTDFKWDSVGGALDVPGDINLDDGGTYTTTLQTITATANRTISFPDATGTVALVAGSSGQLIYNSAGANAGTPTLTYDGSILTSTGRFINSYNATESSPAKAFTGTWFTGGTATTTKPQVLIEPSGTTSGAWSTSGTGLGVNAASGFAGNLLDLQVGGASQLSITSGGLVAGKAGNNTAISYGAAGSISGFSILDANTVALVSAGQYVLYASRGLEASIRIRQSDSYGWGGVNANDSPTLVLQRDASDTLAQRRGTNAQTYRLYNTLTGTDVSATGNYERAYLGWDTNVFKIGTQVGSGGGTPRNVEISGPSASSKLTFTTAGITTADHFTISSALRAGGSTLVAVNGTYQLGFTSTSTITSSVDTGLKRDQAGVLALTDGSTGVGYLKTTPVAVSALPAAATVGAGTRGFVSDSTVAASGNFGAIVAGGGANNVPVFSDGTNWLIG